MATNKSLSVLNKCIVALGDKRAHHIPYRESTLTKVLQDSLGGSSKLMLIATICPSESHYSETLSTLRYASVAKNMAVGKNSIREEALAESARRDEENAMNTLCSDFGFSASHLSLYQVYFCECTIVVFLGMTTCRLRLNLFPGVL